MGAFFGTDGVRGRANAELTPELVFNLGRAAALTLPQDSISPGIIIGRDTRISGDMLVSALAAGICSAGADAILLGEVPTPAVAYLCRHFKVPGAVVSASHNPYEDNGIKFFSFSGDKLRDDEETAIEACLANPEKMPYASGADIGQISAQKDAGIIYADYLAERFPYDFSGKKVVVDAANGAAYAIAGSVFRRKGAAVIEIGCAPDGVNINDRCGSTHPETLVEMVKAEKADIGFALDGDADRLIAVDENGNLVNGDVILAICAAHMQQKGVLSHDTVVATVMSNMGLKIALEKSGIKVLEAKVGDRYVLEMMASSGAVLGGEQSGHIIMSDYNSTGDGLSSALYLLYVMTDTKEPLSSLARRMIALPQHVQNIKVSRKDGWQEIEELTAVIREKALILEGRGRILVRPSGTEPLFRVMAEGDSEEELKNIVTEIAEVIERHLN